MRPTKAIVRLDAITSNVQVVQKLAPQSKVIAVVKANAYGHGAVAVARKLQAIVPAFAVAFMDEAVQLRDAGIEQPILVLQGVSSHEDLAEAVDKNLCLMVHSQQQVESVLHAKLSRPVSIWLKVDTGMHRLGLASLGLDDVFNALSSSPNVQENMVLCTHLACADEPGNPMTMRQIKHIREYATKYALPLSIANSAGIIRWPESHADWVRPGYMLYGNEPVEPENLAATDLIPAMSLQSEIVCIREIEAGDSVGYGQNWIAKKRSIIGIIPIGYADGYPRHAPNGTPVLVNGHRAPLAGMVSMDMISVDLSEIEHVCVGDSVELWGENLSVNEVADRSEAIGYELLAGLTGRVPISYSQS